MDYDLIIIGAGPAGYVAAIRAGQAGLKTAVIEKKHVGGMCLNWGCIPSKAMLESAKYFSRLGMAADFGVEGLDPKSLKFSWEKAVKRSDRIVRRLTKGVEYLLKKNNVETISGTASIEAADTVVVDNRMLRAKNIIIATGYNGSPAGGVNCCDHAEEKGWLGRRKSENTGLRQDGLQISKIGLLSEHRADHSEWSAKNEIHAELNAILFAARNTDFPSP